MAQTNLGRVRGSMIYSGNTDTPNTNGAVALENDLYINLSNGNVYKFQNNSWSLNGNIRGPQGPTGLNGKDGVDGNNGNNGNDGYTFTPSVDTSGNLSWTKTQGAGGSVPPTVNIKGPQGNAGTSYSIEWDGTTLTISSN